MIAARIRSHPATQRTALIPFPLARRRPLVTKAAGQMAAARTAELAEKLLQRRAARLARALRRQRVPDASIGRELRAFELAVRAELWRVLFAPRPRR